MVPSSSGPGHQILILATWVRTPLGLPKIKNARLGVFLIGFPILSRVRKLDGKNYTHFANLRTFQITKTLLSA